MSLTANDFPSVIPILMAIIDMAVVMVHIYSSTLEAYKAHLPHMKKSMLGVHGDETYHSREANSREELDEETLAHLHEKQVLDIVAWHIQVLDAKWYVKPRSTCWFEEYLFKIYTRHVLQHFENTEEDVW